MRNFCYYSPKFYDIEDAREDLNKLPEGKQVKALSSKDVVATLIPRKNGSYHLEFSPELNKYSKNKQQIVIKFNREINITNLKKGIIGNGTNTVTIDIKTIPKKKSNKSYKLLIIKCINSDLDMESFEIKPINYY